MSSSPRRTPDPPREDLTSAEVLVDVLANDDLAAIARLVAATAGLDLARYERAEVERRILRRMALGGHLAVEDYRARLGSDPIERRQLARDFLPSTTAFFSDPGYFEVLRRVVVEPLVRAADGGEIRIWVPGCGGGEEVYSLAMLLLEAAEDGESFPALTIFATDVDVEALERARAGRYPPSIGDGIDAARLRQHFLQRDGGYQICARLRDLVCFGVHDLLHDAPLAGFDLVSCRNLLRYLTEEAADRAVSRLATSLRPGAHLFLGPPRHPAARTASRRSRPSPASIGDAIRTRPRGHRAARGAASRRNWWSSRVDRR
jgi:two-component system, chemotaxis family, CheB/CheR fusion protein